MRILFKLFHLRLFCRSLQQCRTKSATALARLGRARMPSQDASKMAQDGSMMAEFGFKAAQDGFKTAQKSVKTIYLPKEPPRFTSGSPETVFMRINDFQPKRPPKRAPRSQLHCFPQVFE